MERNEQLDSKAQLEHERESKEAAQQGKDPAQTGYDKKLDGPNQPST